MTDTAALQAEPASLREQVARLLPPAPPPIPVVVEPVTVEDRPVQIATLIGDPGSGYLSRDPREVRRIIEAVAICQCAPSPAQTVPASWLPPLRCVAAARADGKCWSTSLAAAGLEASADLTVQRTALRRELSDLWSQVAPVAALTLADLGDIAKDDLKYFLRQLLT